MKTEMQMPGKYKRVHWSCEEKHKTRMGIMIDKRTLHAFKRKAKKDGYLLSDKMREMILAYLDE